MKIGKCSAVTTVAILSFSLSLAYGQNAADSEPDRRDHPVYGEADAGRPAHPLYGDTEPDTFRPGPSVDPTEPGGFQANRVQVSEDLMDLAVFHDDLEEFGRVEDLIVDLQERRVAFVLVRPTREFGREARVNYAIAPQALTVQNGRLTLGSSLQEAETSQVLSQADLAELLGGGQELPQILLVERRTAEGVYGQPGERQQPAQAQQQRPVTQDDEEAVVPPEVRGGVPPEMRGGIPPEERSTVPTDETGLRPRDPSGANGSAQPRGAGGESGGQRR
jgi:sporulation protein YlmC with PRC-barrel domain